MTDPFTSLPGAVAEDGRVLHVGGPMREQRALAAGESVSPLADRTVISVTGEDRLTWLDSITSQAVASLTPGESTELLVLDPQGRVEHAAAVLDDGATTWLIADAGDAEPLAAWLTMMRFRARAEIAVEPELRVVGSIAGGEAERACTDAAHRPNGVPLCWRDPWTGVTAGGWQYAVAEPHPGTEREWIETIVDAAGYARLAEQPVAGLLAAEALRIAAWRPRWQSEVDERAIPHESDWMRTAVHLEKGCYRGQETVAKVHNLGHPPRRIAMLQLDGSESMLPARGDVVYDGEKEAGRVTSAARHYELGPIALAVLTRRTPMDATLEIEHDEARIAAAQEPIVPADAGATAGIPRMSRLSRRRTAT